MNIRKPKLDPNALAPDISLSAHSVCPLTAPLQQVTRWGPPGSWVMTGGPSIRNWIMSGTKYPYWQHEIKVVANEALQYPSGWQWVKGLLGHRIYGGAEGLASKA